MAEARMAFYEETVLPLITRVIAGVDHWLTPMFDPRSRSSISIPTRFRRFHQARRAMEQIPERRFPHAQRKTRSRGYGPAAGGDTLPGADDDDGDSDEDDPVDFLYPDTAVVAPDWEDAKRRPQAGRAKFNPNHDELGRFTFGLGGGNDSDDEDDDSGDEAAPDESQQGYGLFGGLDQPRSVTEVSDSTSPATYPTSTISSLSDAQRVVNDFSAHHLGRDNECVSLVHSLAPDLPPASQWLPGDKVQDNTSIPVGTPIATFNFQGQSGTTGYGPPDSPGGEQGQSHAGIYLGQDASGLSILHQWSGSNGPRIETIPWGPWGKTGQEGGSRYYTIGH